MSIYKSLVSLFLLLVVQCMFGQNITGIVYDNKDVVEGVLIKNIRTNIVTVSNDKGYFEIGATIQDSISFKVLTHEEKLLIIKKEDYANFIVELTRKVNQLDEVIVKKQTEFVFKKEEFAESFESQIQKHIELYPEQYEFNSNPNGNLNFVNIGKKLWKLITKNKSKRPKPIPFVPIKLEQYIGLFKEDSIINDRFLTETVKIPLEFKPLFIDYCISQNVDSKLLKGNNKFLLIEEFINLGKEFKEVLETAVDD